MKRFLGTLSLCAALCFGAFALDGARAADDDAALRQTRLEDLGRALFFDVNLSQDRTQSCATCHDPALAFIDWRAFVGIDPAAEPGRHLPGAASLGGDQHSLGDRNAPVLTNRSCKLLITSTKKDSALAGSTKPNIGVRRLLKSIRRPDVVSADKVDKVREELGI